MSSTGTVQVHFVTDTEEYTMIFGNSYKTWRMQLQEYIWQLKNKKVGFKIGDIYLSHARFIQDGLKWCTIEEYEKEMERVGRDFKAFTWHKIDLPKSIEL